MFALVICMKVKPCGVHHEWVGGAVLAMTLIPRRDQFLLTELGATSADCQTITGSFLVVKVQS